MSRAAPEALCPATMQGEGGNQYPLSGLTIMRDEDGAGWKNFAAAADQSWTLPQTVNVRYRAACEYGDEIIGVAVEARFRRCWIERGAGGVQALCEI